MTTARPATTRDPPRSWPLVWLAGKWFLLGCVASIAMVCGIFEARNRAAVRLLMRGGTVQTRHVTRFAIAQRDFSVDVVHQAFMPSDTPPAMLRRYRRLLLGTPVFRSLKPHRRMDFIEHGLPYATAKPAWDNVLIGIADAVPTEGTAVAKARLLALASETTDEPTGISALAYCYRLAAFERDLDTLTQVFDLAVKRYRDSPSLPLLLTISGQVASTTFAGLRYPYLREIAQHSQQEASRGVAYFEIGIEAISLSHRNSRPDATPSEDQKSVRQNSEGPTLEEGLAHLRRIYQEFPHLAVPRIGSYGTDGAVTYLENLMETYPTGKSVVDHSNLLYVAADALRRAPESLCIGCQGPSTVGHTPRGTLQSIRDFRGKPLLLCFARDQQRLEDWHTRFGQQVHILLVDDVTQPEQSLLGPWITWWDGPWGAVANEWSRSPQVRCFVLDRQGKIVWFGNDLAQVESVVTECLARHLRE